MGTEITKIKIITSLLWKVVERGAAYGVQFVSLIILARVLLPEDFGTFTLAMTFIILANVFIQGGFSIGLIQKKESDELDFSSVLYLNLAVAAILYCSVYFIAPLIAHYFDQPMFIPLLRVLAITFFIVAINAVQNAYISKQFAFKKLFLSSLTAALISVTVSIVLAYNDFGIWALVVQHLLNQSILTIVLSIIIGWRPKWIFSIRRLRMLYSFSWKLFVSSFIDTLYVNIQNIIIGKLFNPKVLGYFNRGEQIPSLIVNNVNGSIQSVMLPALANEQDNLLKMKSLMRRAIVTSSFIIFPMMVGLAVIAEPLILILLSEKWLPAVPFLQIFCGIYAFWPIHTTNLQAINALGRSDIYLKLEIIKKCLGIVILFFCIPYGVYSICLGILGMSILGTLINAAPNRALFNYSVREQAKDIFPSLLLSFAMGVIIYSINLLAFTALQTMLLQIVMGIIVYIGLAWIFRLECFNYLLEIGKGIINRKKTVKQLINKEV